MQISIEQHDAVIAGLVTELNIRQEQLSHTREELKLAREDFGEVEEDRNLLSKQLTHKALEYERMLERIRQVAVGDYPPCTGVMEPEWSQALAAVETLRTRSADVPCTRYEGRVGRKRKPATRVNLLHGK